MSDALRSAVAEWDKEEAAGTLNLPSPALRDAVSQWDKEDAALATINAPGFGLPTAEQSAHMNAPIAAPAAPSTRDLIPPEPGPPRYGKYVGQPEDEHQRTIRVNREARERAAIRFLPPLSEPERPWHGGPPPSTKPTPTFLRAVDEEPGYPDTPEGAALVELENQWKRQGKIGALEHMDRFQYAAGDPGEGVDVGGSDAARRAVGLIPIVRGVANWLDEAGLKSAVGKLSRQKDYGDVQPDQLKAAEERVKQFLLNRRELQIRGTTLVGEAITSAMQMPAYMLEFAATGGLVSKTLRPAASAFGWVRDTTLRHLLAKTAAWTAGGVARTLTIGAGETLAETTRRSADKYVLDRNGGLVKAENGEPLGIAFVKGFANQTIENMSEVAGEKIMGAAGKVMGQIRGADKVLPALQRSFLRRLHVSAAAMKQTGFHGMTEEMAEEWLGKAMRTAVSEVLPGEPLDTGYLPTARELGVQFLSFLPSTLGFAAAGMRGRMQERREARIAAREATNAPPVAEPAPTPKLTPEELAAEMRLGEGYAVTARYDAERAERIRQSELDGMTREQAEARELARENVPNFADQRQAEQMARQREATRQNIPAPRTPQPRMTEAEWEAIRAERRYNPAEQAPSEAAGQENAPKVPILAPEVPGAVVPTRPEAATPPVVAQGLPEQGAGAEVPAEPPEPPAAVTVPAAKEAAPAKEAWAYHRTTREALTGIAREGMSQGDFTTGRAIDFPGDVTIRVRESDIPNPQIGEYGKGVRWLLPQYEVDEEGNPQKVIPPDKVEIQLGKKWVPLADYPDLAKPAVPSPPEPPAPTPSQKETDRWWITVDLASGMRPGFNAGDIDHAYATRDEAVAVARRLRKEGLVRSVRIQRDVQKPAPAAPEAGKTAATDLQTLTAKELRTRARERGLTIFGTRTELIKRLTATPTELEAEKQRRRQQALDQRHPMDTPLTDAVEELGGIRPRSKSSGGEYDEAPRPFTPGTGNYRRIFNKDATHTPDTIIQELHATRPELVGDPTDVSATIARLWADLAAEGKRKKGSFLEEEERAAAGSPEAEAELAKANKQRLVPADKLNLGDSWTVDGEKHVVTEVGDQAIHVEDGIDEWITHGSGQRVRIDRGSFKKGQGAETPPAEAAAERPKGNIKLAGLPDGSVPNAAEDGTISVAFDHKPTEAEKRQARKALRAAGAKGIIVQGQLEGAPSRVEGKVAPARAEELRKANKPAKFGDVDETKQFAEEGEGQKRFEIGGKEVIDAAQLGLGLKKAAAAKAEAKSEKAKELWQMTWDEARSPEVGGTLGTFEASIEKAAREGKPVSAENLAKLSRRTLKELGAKGQTTAALANDLAAKYAKPAPAGGAEEKGGAGQGKERGWRFANDERIKELEAKAAKRSTAGMGATYEDIKDAFEYGSRIFMRGTVRWLEWAKAVARKFPDVARAQLRQMWRDAAATAKRVADVEKKLGKPLAASKVQDIIRQATEGGIKGEKVEMTPRAAFKAQLKGQSFAAARGYKAGAEATLAAMQPEPVSERNLIETGMTGERTVNEGKLLSVRMKAKEQQARESTLTAQKELVEIHKRIGEYATEQLGENAERVLPIIAGTRTRADQIHVIAAIDALKDNIETRTARHRAQDALKELKGTYRELPEPQYGLAKAIQERFQASAPTAETRARLNATFDAVLNNPDVAENVPPDVLGELKRLQQVPVSEMTREDANALADYVEHLTTEGERKVEIRKRLQLGDLNEDVAHATEQATGMRDLRPWKRGEHGLARSAISANDTALGIVATTLGAHTDPSGDRVSGNRAALVLVHDLADAYGDSMGEYYGIVDPVDKVAEKHYGYKVNTIRMLRKRAEMVTVKTPGMTIEGRTKDEVHIRRDVLWEIDLLAADDDGRAALTTRGITVNAGRDKDTTAPRKGEKAVVFTPEALKNIHALVEADRPFLDAISDANGKDFDREDKALFDLTWRHMEKAGGAYHPMRRDMTGHESMVRVYADPVIQYQSQFKDRKGGSQPLLLNGAVRTFLEHANGTAMLVSGEAQKVDYANRFLKAITPVLRAKGGDHAVNELRENIVYGVQSRLGPSNRSGADRLIRGLTRNMSTAAVPLSATVTALQGTSWPLLLNFVSPKAWAAGVKNSTAHPLETRAEMRRIAPDMRTRYEMEYADLLSGSAGRLDEVRGVMSKMRHGANLPMQGMDMEGTSIELEALKYEAAQRGLDGSAADRWVGQWLRYGVNSTQSNGNPYLATSLERKASTQPLWRFATLFHNWPSHIYDLGRRLVASARQGHKGSIPALLTYAATLTVAMGSTLVVRRFWRQLMGKDQPEGWLEEAGEGVAGLVYGGSELYKGVAAGVKGKQVEEITIPALEGPTKLVYGGGKLIRGLTQWYDEEVARNGKAKADATLLKAIDTLIQGVSYTGGVPLAPYRMLRDLRIIPGRPDDKKGSGVAPETQRPTTRSTSRPITQRSTTR